MYSLPWKANNGSAEENRKHNKSFSLDTEKEGICPK